ncbi:MAG: cyclic nucleotide-binding domain-containing protein [Myxococcales bacterium]|nr:cyclic nucleotide-binding domain-containing protein [Myxococcales bacterium]
MVDQDTKVALRRHPLLVRLDTEQLARVTAAGEVEQYQSDEVIVSEGSLGDAMFLVLAGRAAIIKEGAGPRALAELAAGEFFGEMSLVDAAVRSASVVAVSEGCRVFRLPNTALRALAEEDPRAMNAVLVAIVRVLSDRLRHMNETIAAVASLSDWLAGAII